MTSAVCDILFRNILLNSNFTVSALKIRPCIVTISGPVGSGKSFLAGQLNQKLLASSIKSCVVSTDNFLLDNNELLQKKILKGFPDSYDLAWMKRFFQQVSQRQMAVYPCYAHQDYDRDAHIQQQLSNDLEVVIIEGLNALSLKPSDLAVYLLADSGDCIKAISARTIQLFQQYPCAKHPLNQQPFDIEKTRQAVLENWRNINRHSSWLHRPLLLQRVHYVHRARLFPNRYQQPLAVLYRNLYWRWRLFRMLSTY